MNFLAFTGLTNLIATTALAAMVFAKKPYEVVAKAYVRLNLMIAGWSFFYLLWQISTTSADVHMWFPWLLLFTVWINQAFLHFVLTLTDKLRSHRNALYAAALLNVLFSILNFKGYLYSAFEPRNGLGLWPNATWLFALYVAFWHAELFYAFWVAIKSFRQSAGRLREQISYVIFAFAIAYFGGCTNWFLCFGINIPPYLNFLVTIHAGLIAYAIVKHRLMDITIVIRTTVIYSVLTGIVTAVLVFIATLLSQYTEGFLGRKTLYTSAFAACLITLMFHPLQLAVRSFVNRYFFPNWQDRETVREVAAGFSHELKSPLAGLSMRVQLMLGELQAFKEEQLPLLDALHKIEDGLKYVLGQAMDTALRIEAVRGVAEPIAGKIGPVEVAAVLDSGLVSLESQLSRMDLSVRRDLSTALPLVRSNEKQLEIVFINLIKNALDAMQEKEHHNVLLLSGVEQDDSVLISIKDTGAGIARKDVSHIFEPNFTTKGRRGTGMGLYLTQQIVSAHGGSIEVISEEGKGTEFIVKLLKYMPNLKADIRVA